MTQALALASLRRPGIVMRAAAGAWQVPAGFGFLLRRPGLWPLAVLPVVLAVLLMSAGAVLGVYLVPNAERALAPPPGRLPEWVELPMSLLLWVAAFGAGVFLGLAVALLLTAPLLDALSRRVEARVRGSAEEAGRGLGWEIVQSLRGAFYFLLAAPFVFALGLIPIVGPLLSMLLGARAVAFQMTEPALSRRGMTFVEKRRWHRRWLVETQGFGMAGMVALLVPFANLLLGPALVTGATLLVLEIEDLDAAAPRPATGGARPPSPAHRG
jgi:CysZ protein